MKFAPVSDVFRSRSQRTRARAVLFALFVCLLGAKARADDPAGGDEQAPPSAALDHYGRGREHYQAGRYREALGELQQALALDPNSPNLVYNVARVHELLGEIDEAIAYYKRYEGMLSEDDEERARVQATLLRLEGAREQVEEPSEGAAPKPPQMKRGVADATFWAFAIAGGASLASGAVTGVLALGAARDADNFVLGEDGSAKKRRLLIDRADRLALATDVLIGAGIGLAVTSALLYMLRKRPVEQPSTRVEIAPTAHGAVLTLGGAL